MDCFVNAVFLFLCLKRSILHYMCSTHFVDRIHKATGKNDNVPMLFENLNGAYVSDYSSEFA